MIIDDNDFSYYLIIHYSFIIPYEINNNNK